MIDCSRHFEPVGVIERTLDAMAAVKMNVFHWHLTDDQGFRIESKVFPKLTGMGSDGQFYTQEQAKEIVAYARARAFAWCRNSTCPATALRGGRLSRAGQRHGTVTQSNASLASSIR